MITAIGLATRGTVVNSTNMMVSHHLIEGTSIKACVSTKHMRVSLKGVMRLDRSRWIL